MAVIYIDQDATNWDVRMLDGPRYGQGVCTLPL